MTFRIPGQMEISVPISSDDEGYFDKECPSQECLSKFKVMGEDWDKILQTGTAFCPFCRHEASPRSWWTTEQIEHAKKMAIAKAHHAISREIGSMLKGMASDFNRRQSRNSWIKMTMDVRGTDRPAPIMLPASAAKAMRIKITCGKCGCRYAVVGTAYFCPACGRSDPEGIFSAKIEKVRSLPQTIEKLRASLDRDEASDLANTLLEDAIKGGVTQFETVAKFLYAQTPQPKTLRQNIFQNLADGSLEWWHATGESFENFVNAIEWEKLNVYFQRRHILGHNDGHVDEKYLNKSGDPSYRPEQRLVVKPDAATEFADLLEKLVAGMKASV
jgi:uncharacterized Zn finger protein (UPF0148 family)